jgi:O-antigen/teichoic acid export membrane protein
MKSATVIKPTIFSRSMNSGAWTLGAHVFIQFFRLASNLVMARLLVPELFGVMALTNVLIFGMMLFSDIGLHHNVVQSKRGDDPEFLNTVWTTQLIRGVLVFVIGALLSFLLVQLNAFEILPKESTYAHPILPSVLLMMSFSAILMGFEPTKVSTAMRNLAVKELRIIEFFSHLAGIIFMLVWAWISPTIWALVFSSWFSVVIKNALCSWILPGEGNKIYWNKAYFKEIFGFGKWVFLSSIAGFLCMTGDRLMLGGMMTQHLFGQYAIAILIFSAGKELFSKINGSVIFPALSEVFRNNPQNLKVSYYKFRFASDSLLALGAGMLYVTAPIIMSTLYDERYAESGLMLQILAIGLLGFRYELTNQCFIGMGKPKYLTIMTYANMVVLFTLTPIVNHFYGNFAALWAISLSSLVTIPLVIFFKIRKNIMDWKRELIGLVFLPIGYLLGLGIVEIVNSFLSKG